jgi:hypothetical protein
VVVVEGGGDFAVFDIHNVEIVAEGVGQRRSDPPKYFEVDE